MHCESKARNINKRKALLSLMMIFNIQVFGIVPMGTNKEGVL